MSILGVNLIKHHVNDWPAAIAFYRDVLGLKPLFEVPGLWAQFETPDGGRIGLVMEHEGIRRPPHVVLKVDDLAASIAALARAGPSSWRGRRTATTAPPCCCVIPPATRSN
jgi:catechol 2,3-dioxygenase-like lactoylglutathione lyase family enzyme